MLSRFWEVHLNKKDRVIEMKLSGNFRQGSRQTKENMRGTDYKEADEN